MTRLINDDPWRTEVLRAAASLDLPDWWIGAGFLRNLVWDTIEHNATTHTRDVDLVYYSREDTEPETDWAYDEQMNREYPLAEWEIRNQARMHYMDDFKPYHSTVDGIAHWVETATCVGVKLEDEQLRYIFCYGTDDLFGLIARPTPLFQNPTLLPVFHKRVEKKRWREKWPRLTVIDS